MNQPHQLQRLQVRLHGAVQGVGFRPFVHRLATEMGLAGWVVNSTRGVTIEVEGPSSLLDTFLLRLAKEAPPRAAVHGMEPTRLDPAGYEGFEIRESEASGDRTAIVLPDIATCADCLREVLDPADRRHLYPFTNCTNCGPRFSIIESLPYDRPGTTMRRFSMCPSCRREYDDPADRRFHAQPNACPDCGPHLELWDPSGRVSCSRHEALLAAAKLIRDGGTVAVKGLGGFHLLADAGNDGAVLRLRERKRREEKPLAVMFPSALKVREACEVSDLEDRLLRSPEAPIVLLRSRGESRISPSVAPGNPSLGAMIPYTPLHHLLLAELGIPVVATSGNLSDEPICIDERDAIERLRGIADSFLVHDRPIARHVDDSVVRVLAGRELVLRRARGYAPLPVPTNESLPGILGVGAHLKSTVALGWGGDVHLSQHIGDLETTEALSAFRGVIEDLQAMRGVKPRFVACDLHPDYLSSIEAQKLGLEVHAVQHHHAHVVACMAENRLDGTVLGVSWDGTGLGTDGTIWGGEFLLATRASFERAAHFRTFPLPGGDRAIREPRRSALGLLHEAFGGDLSALRDIPSLSSFEPRELDVLLDMLRTGTNCPRTSSAGRLFDAVASIAGIRQVSRFEGQAAMELEFALPARGGSRRYHMDVAPARGPACRVIDWKPSVLQIIEDVRSGRGAGEIALAFHDGLAEVIVQVAANAGQDRVVLTGGCFQNRYLTERVVERLREEGFRPYWHQRVPPNDGGISLGQVVAAANNMKGK